MEMRQIFVGKLLIERRDEGPGEAEYTVSMMPMSEEDKDALLGIVRCRECEFYNDHHFKCHRPVTLIAKDGTVTRTDEDDTFLAMTDAHPDGFCLWGERRVEE